MCSPSVCGGFSTAFGISDLSLIRGDGKMATRPCHCGYLGHYSGRCHCTPGQVARYRSRISGPLLDRIDLRIEVPALTEGELLRAGKGESSHVVRTRVAGAREIQLRRQGIANAQLSVRALEEYAPVDDEGKRLLRDATCTLNLSARAHHRVIRVSRTIADLEECATIRSEHIAETLLYRGN